MKGRVRRVADDVFAEVEELESKDVIRVHQDLLRVVVPSVGRKVVVLQQGPFRKREGLLLSFDNSTKTGSILLSGDSQETPEKDVTISLKYGEFSKRFEG